VPAQPLRAAGLEEEQLAAQHSGDQDGPIVVHPIVVLSKTFPARPSSIPDIRDFVRRNLADSPLSVEDTRELQSAVAQALLDAASPDGAFIQVSFRIFPDEVEVDILKSPANPADLPAVQQALQAPEARAAEVDESFANWMAAVLKREGLSQEAAARQLGVSVKTVSRWVGGETEPRLRELRRIREVFGEVPIP
jgi:DNA-binding transcriptional regulator YiaG